MGNTGFQDLHTAAPGQVSMYWRGWTETPARPDGNSDHDIPQRPCPCYAVLCVYLLLYAVPAAADVNPGVFPSETAATRLSVRFPRPTYKNYAYDLYQNYADHSVERAWYRRAARNRIRCRTTDGSHRSHGQLSHHRLRPVHLGGAAPAGAAFRQRAVQGLVGVAVGIHQRGSGQ